MSTDQNLDLSVIKEIVQRRKWWLVGPFICVVVLTAAVAFLLPDYYKSTATILIKDQQIPTTMVQAAITSYADQRIQSISQEAMSRSRILNLVEKYDLLPKKREKLTTEELVEKVRKRINLETINAEVNKETDSRPIHLTIAFSLSFEDPDPKKAQLVTNEVASYFLEKSTESREKVARGASKFLAEQLKDEKERMDALQAKLAEFQEAHLEELPDFMTLNMQKLDRFNATTSEINMQIRSLEEQRSTLKGNLALLDPYSGGGGRSMSPSERRQQAKLELAQLLSRYSKEHPAVQAKEQEITLLEKDAAGSGDDDGQAEDRLGELEGKLAAMQSRYGSKHPDVLNTKSEIERIKKELSQSPSGQARRGLTSLADANNPAYVNLRAELDKISVSITSLNAEKARVEKQIKQTYAKLQAMPQVAKEFNAIQTDYLMSKQHYDEIQQKLLGARVSQGMEEEQLGGSFEIVEPAFFPEKPFKPNRLVILLIGVLMGMGSSVGAASVREHLDKRIHDSDALEKSSGVQVISVISRITTAEDLVRTRRRRIMALGATLCSVAGCLIAFHLLIMDLNVFYAKLERFIWRKMP